MKLIRKVSFYTILIITFGSLNGLFNMLFGVGALFSPILLLLTIFIISTHPFKRSEKLGGITKSFYLYSTSWVLVGTIALFAYQDELLLEDFWKCFREYVTALLIYTSIFLYCIERNREEVKDIVKFSLMIFIIAASITVLDSVINLRSNYVAGLKDSSRSLGVFANPNETGFQANLTLSMVIGLYFHQKIKTLLAIIGMGIALAASLLSFSKMAMIMSGTLIGVFCIISISKLFVLNRKKRKGKTLFLVILAAFFLIIVPSFNAYFNSLELEQQKRINGVFLLVTSGKINAKTTSGREGAVLEAVEMVSRNPLLGYGLNSFSRGGKVIQVSVHNYYIKMIGESGILTLLFFISFLAIFFFKFLVRPDVLRIAVVLVIIIFSANCIASHNSLGDKFSIGLLGLLASLMYSKTNQLKTG